MNAACKEVERDLPLFAEGEIQDAAGASRVRLHLRSCAACRRLAERYRELTQAILEAEPGEAPPFVGARTRARYLPDPLKGEDDALEPALYEARSPFSAGERTFTERVMTSVRGIEKERRSARLRRLAAALIVFSALSGGLVWLGGRLRSPEAPSEIAAGMMPPPAALLRGGTGPDIRLAAASEPRPSLNSPWWVIGPERELEEATAREMEAVLYALLLREGSQETGECLMWKAFLGSSPRKPLDSGGGIRLFMVPEEGGTANAIPLRPAALPIRLAERDLAPPARFRLTAPPRRYRIVLPGGQEWSGPLSPAALPPGKDAARPFPPERPAIDFLPLSPQRY